MLSRAGRDGVSRAQERLSTRTVVQENPPRLSDVPAREGGPVWRPQGLAASAGPRGAETPLASPGLGPPPGLDPNATDSRGGEEPPVPDKPLMRAET